MGNQPDVMDFLTAKPKNDGLVSQGTMDKIANGIRSFGIPVGGTTNTTEGTTSGLDAAMQAQANKLHPVPK